MPVALFVGWCSRAASFLDVIQGAVEFVFCNVSVPVPINSSQKRFFIHAHTKQNTAVAIRDPQAPQPRGPSNPHSLGSDSVHTMSRSVGVFMPTQTPSASQLADYLRRHALEERVSRAFSDAVLNLVEDPCRHIAELLVGRPVVTEVDQQVSALKDEVRRLAEELAEERARRCEPFKHWIFDLMRANGDAVADGMLQPQLPPPHEAESTIADESSVETDSTAMHKFQTRKAFVLEFGGVNHLHAGLEGLVGPPHPSLLDAVHDEHCTADDSKEEFVSSNYRIATTSIVEWYFVFEPEDGLQILQLDEWPVESRAQLSERRGRPCPLADYQADLVVHNDRLKVAGAPQLVMAELAAARLYTGPMFLKYNSVLRGEGVGEGPLADSLRKLCRGNRYTTTLHLISSAVVKLSRLTRATVVYRGVAGGELPRAFIEEDEHAIRGGIELAFMSTSLHKDVAQDYARDARGGLVFVIQQGMADRGADLSWLSQYPSEREICFGPCTGLEVQSTRVEQHAEGASTWIECRVATAPNGQTIEEVRPRLSVHAPCPCYRRRSCARAASRSHAGVHALQVLSRMRHAHMQLIDASLSDLRFAGAPARTLVPLLELREEYVHRPRDWFNDFSNFKLATEQVIDVEAELLGQLGTWEAWDLGSHQLDAVVGAARRASMAAAGSGDGGAADDGHPQLAKRMRDCAVLCARNSQHEAAIGILRLLADTPGMLRPSTSQARLTVGAAAVDAGVACTAAAAAAATPGDGRESLTASVPASERWCLRVMDAILAMGVHPPWPATVVTLATSKSAALQAALMQMCVAQQPMSGSSSSGKQQRQAADDTYVLAWTRERGWQKAAVLQRRSPLEGGFVANVNGRPVEGPSMHLLPTSEGGPGAVLREAASRGMDMVVQSLLDARVSCFSASPEANTALHLAADAGHLSTCRLLMAAAKAAGGAKGWDEVGNIHSHSAYDIAFRKRRTEIRRLFHPSAADKDLSADACAATPLLRAVVARDEDETAQLLAAGADPDEAQKNGVAPLMVAAQADALGCLRLLLGARANPNSLSKSGVTALHIAAGDGRREVLELLLEGRADPLLQSPGKKKTALWCTWLRLSPPAWAARLEPLPSPHLSPLPESARAPHPNRCAPRACGPFAETHHGSLDVGARADAASNGFREIVRLLLDSGVQLPDAPDRDGIDAMSRVCRNGYYDVGELLLQRRAPIDTKDKDEHICLVWACRSGFKSVAELVLEEATRRAEPIESAQMDVALHETCEHGHAEVTSSLLRHAATTAAANAAAAACAPDAPAPAPYLASPAVLGQALLLGALYGHEPVVMQLLEHATALGLDRTRLLEATDADGAEGGERSTAEGPTEGAARPSSATLALAAASATSLVRAASATLVGPRHAFPRTPLCCASQMGHVSLVRSLLSERAAVQPAHVGGMSPLLLACAGGHGAIVRLLLDATADVHSCLADGTTAAMLAAEGGHSFVVQMLHKAGADLASVRHDGHSAHSLARSRMGSTAASTRCVLQALGDGSEVAP